MNTLRMASHLRILGQTVLLVGALTLGCDRATQVESAPQRQALSATVAPSTAATSLSASTPVDDGLDEFKEALARKFDRSRWRERPASPQGGILHMPNGQAVHAAIVVKDPDGTVRTECVSSSAEVSALVDEIRGRRAP
jgi:hypothetical protein